MSKRKSVKARIGKKLHEVIWEKAREKDMSFREASDILAMEITGENIFLTTPKTNEKKRRNLFG